MENNTDIKLIFGQRLTKLREAKKIQQNTAAYDLGMAPQVLAYYEKGKRTPDYAGLNKLANYYNVSVGYLTGNIEYKTAQEEYVSQKLNSQSENEKSTVTLIKNLEYFISQNLKSCIEDEQLSSIFNRMLDIINDLLNSHKLYYSSDYNEYISNSKELFLYLSKFYKYILEDSFKGETSIKDKINGADAIISHIDNFFNELKWLPFEIDEPTYNKNEEE